MKSNLSDSTKRIKFNLSGRPLGFKRTHPEKQVSKQLIIMTKAQTIDLESTDCK